MIHRGFKIELKLNKKQEELCIKSAGTSRFAYNWMLNNLNERYEKAKQEAKEQNLDKINCKLGTFIDWDKEWVLLKNELPWIRDVSKCCGSVALVNLNMAFKRFFSKTSKYPTLKKRTQYDSFTLNNKVYIYKKHIQLPRIGKVKLKEINYFQIPEGVKRIKLTSATVSRQADRWFVSFIIKEDVEIPELSSLETIELHDILGVDLGIKNLAIPTKGEPFKNPQSHRKYLKRLKKYQRRVSRKVKGSNNKKKSIKRLSKLYMKISNIRKDSVHKMTTSLVKTKPKMIVIETLNVEKLIKSNKLAGAILDSSFGMIKETLKYKCGWNGIYLVQAPPFYASSKYCSECGHKYKDLKLSTRTWVCKNCGSDHDRDVNAAKNLQYFGLWMIDKHLDENPTTVSSTGCQACGDERLQFLIEQCSSMKQEFNNILNERMKAK